MPARSPAGPRISVSRRPLQRRIYTNLHATTTKSREREVIERRFGLDGHRRQTLAELGKHLGLSRERVRQIEKDALVRLQHSRELLEIYLDVLRAE